MPKSTNEPNVWEAWHKDHEEPHFFVGHYGEEDGTFWREPTRGELEREPGLKQVVGPFDAMCQHNRVSKDNYHNARVMAKERYGYSKKVAVPEGAQLGKLYGVRKLVIV